MQRTIRHGLCAALFLAGLLPAQLGGMYDLTRFRQLKISFATAQWFATLVANKPSGAYLKADIDIDGVVIRNVGVRARGASAFNAGRQNGKLPLKISFDEYDPNGQFLGRRAMDLNNGYWTPTFMREVLTLEMMREFIPAPRANFVNVTINGVNHGVYINVERPNKDFARDNFRDDGGNRYHGRTVLMYRGTSPANYAPYYPLSSSPTPDAYLDLIKALTTTTLTGSQAFVEIPKLCDVDGSLKVEALNQVFGNRDAYPRHNYYLYVDPYHDQMVAIPWDVNLAFRTTSVLSAQRFYTHSQRWVKQYQAHMRAIAEHSLDWAKLAPKVAAWQALIDTAVQNDPLKFYPYQWFQAGVLSTVGTYKGLKPFVEDMRRTILQQYSAPQVQLTAATQAPMNPGPNDAVWVTVRAAASVPVGKVQLHWRSKGPFVDVDMFDDGQHRDGQPGDGVYGVQLPFRSPGATVDYYFSAETNLGEVSFLPIFTGHQPFTFRFQHPARTSVVIHEWMASNTKTLKDENNEYEDWIELYNPTNARVDVGGMYLSDDRANSKMWQLPANIFLDPGASLIIWADAEVQDGPLHANFKLSDGGEELFLSSAQGAFLDYVVFGKQQPDVSAGRLEDRADPVFVSHLDATPLARNGLYGCGTRRYSALQPGNHTLTLDVVGLPQAGRTVQVNFSGAPANVGYVLMIDAQPAAIDLRGLGFTLLIGGPLLSISVPTTSSAPLSVPMNIPNDPNIDGLRLAMQALSAQQGRILASNAVQVQFCR